MSIRKLAPNAPARIGALALICLMFVACCLGLTGCHDGQNKDAGSKENAARAYYNGKYNTNASIEKAHMCRTESGTLGSTPTYDYYYEMSDGSTVMYLAKTGSFVDDRQYEEIRTAIDNEVWNPQLQKLQESTSPQELTMEGLIIGGHKSGTYQGKGFATYYNGNINEFMQAEHPTISFENVQMLTNSTSDQEQLYQFCLWIIDNFTPDYILEVICVSPDSLDAKGQPICDESYCKMMLSDKGVFVNDLHYVTLIDGVEITANEITTSEHGFQLGEGDITVEIVPVSEVQAKIDEAYNALPYESEDNKSGNYKTRDQVHEDRDVLLEGTAFRLHFTDRVKDASSNNGLSCLVKFSDQLTKRGYWLFRYSFDKTGSITSGSAVCMPQSQMDSKSLREEDYFFLGKVERGKAGEESRILG